MTATSHASPAKVAEVDLLAARMKDATVVGIVSVQGIPARQFQAKGRGIHGDAHRFDLAGTVQGLQDAPDTLQIRRSADVGDFNFHGGAFRLGGHVARGQRVVSAAG